MLAAEHMESLIRRYVDGCNDAAVEDMIACFTPTLGPERRAPSVD